VAIADRLCNRELRAFVVNEPLKFDKKAKSLTEAEQKIQRDQLLMLTRWGTIKNRYEDACVFVVSEGYMRGNVNLLDESRKQLKERDTRSVKN